MSSDSLHETPWGEEQWERFMRESDVRSARYGELLETLIDHPDRDEIIAREMGWDDEDDSPEAEEDWQDELQEAMNEPLSDDELEEYRRDQGEVEDIPAYAHSFEWASRIFHTLKREFRGEDEDLLELLADVLRDSRTVAAKIAGGHGMGYDEDSLCGNIVCCKRSLEAADECLRSLRELAVRQPRLAGIIAPMIEQGRSVRQLVADRIEELRSRVWWE